MRGVKQDPVVIGSIDYSECVEICALLKYKDSCFLSRISDLFQDQSFSVEELIQAQSYLLALLPIELSSKERALLHKLIDTPNSGTKFRHNNRQTF